MRTRMLELLLLEVKKVQREDNATVLYLRDAIERIEDIDADIGSLTAQVQENDQVDRGDR